MTRVGSIAIFLGYLGAVIGAGFASGQEIVQFFVRYGPPGLLGVAVAGGGFAIMGAILVWAVKRERKRNYQEVLESLMGRRLGKLCDIAISVFLFLGICTMMSASGAVFYEHLYLSKNLGILVAYLGILVGLSGGMRGLVASYNLLVPAKILLLLFVAIYATCRVGEVSASADTILAGMGDADYWLIAALLYVAYNFTLAMVVLTEYATLMSLRRALVGVVAGGAVLGVTAGVFYLALSAHLPQAFYYEVPMLYVAGMASAPARMAYVVVLWLGIITTAMANAYGLAQRLSSLIDLSYRSTLVGLVSLALPLSFQAFSRLVAVVYPLFGFLGMAVVIALLVKAFGFWGADSGRAAARIWRS